MCVCVCVCVCVCERERELACVCMPCISPLLFIYFPPKIKMYCIFEPAYVVVLNRPFPFKSCCAGWLTDWLIDCLTDWLIDRYALWWYDHFYTPVQSGDRDPELVTVESLRGTLCPGRLSIFWGQSREREKILETVSVITFHWWNLKKSQICGIIIISIRTGAARFM